MKITKEMGRACLRMMGTAPVHCSIPVHRAFIAMGWTMEVGQETLFDDYQNPTEHSDTALAMCAAIAGVKPEDVE